MKSVLADAAQSAPGNSDRALVERALAGDSLAFELLVIKYRRRVQGLIGRIVRDTDQIEDIAQETFINAYRALHQFRGEAQFYTWLYRIAVNTAKKFLLDAKRHRANLHQSLQQHEEDETYWRLHEPSTDETPESLLAAKEIAFAVNAALLALPDDLKQALTLREIDSMAYEDIADVMNCPLGTVRSRIFRAREAVSHRIKPLLDKYAGKRW